MHAESKKKVHLEAVTEDARFDDSGGIGDAGLDLANLYRRYCAYVAFIAHRLIGVPTDVDDIVQDVFIDAERGLAKLRDMSSVKGWLATITVRRARKYLRKRRFRQILGLDRMPDYEKLVDSSATPEQCAMIASVYRILDTFPADDRIAWTLKYVHEEKINHVAKLCGCSRATAHRRIAAVQSVIREAMDE